MPKLKTTKDYALFHLSDTNRGISPRHIRKIKTSMEMYGWIPAFPMLVKPATKGLEVVDGQHRLTVSKDLDIPVWYVEIDRDFDVAGINNGAEAWRISDYCNCFVNSGKYAYVEVMEFAEKHGLGICDAAGLLAGTIRFTNVSREFKDGSYQITDREHADKVANIYSGLRAAFRCPVNQSLFYAIVAISRVDSVDIQRLIKNAERNPDRFIKCSTRDSALKMLEDVYNYHARGDKYPLQINAENAMRDRSPCKAKN
jgi:hypothetical protein